MTRELEWIETSRSNKPVSAREILDEATQELVRRGFHNPKQRRLDGAVVLHHIVSASLSIQCENLGVPYDSEEVKKLTDSLRLGYDPIKLLPVVDVPDGWYDRVDRMFKLRTCAHCGSLLFPGTHSQDECDREIVRGVMES
jgi:hypothetical protein